MPLEAMAVKSLDDERARGGGGRGVDGATLVKEGVVRLQCFGGRKGVRAGMQQRERPSERNSPQASQRDGVATQVERA